MFQSYIIVSWIFGVSYCWYWRCLDWSLTSRQSFYVLILRSKKNIISAEGFRFRKNCALKLSVFRKMKLPVGWEITLLKNILSCAEMWCNRFNMPQFGDISRLLPRYSVVTSIKSLLYLLPQVLVWNRFICRPIFGAEVCGTMWKVENQLHIPYEMTTQELTACVWLLRRFHSHGRKVLLNTDITVIEVESWNILISVKSLMPDQGKTR